MKNISEVSEGNTTLMFSLGVAIDTIGENAVEFFLDLVPERGDELYLRFRRFRKENDVTPRLGFAEFVWSTLETYSDPMRAMFPKGCSLRGEARSERLPVAAEIFAQMKMNEYLDVYFNRGWPYQMFKAAICGCCHEGCKHRPN